jgi:hypothetical protein
MQCTLEVCCCASECATSWHPMGACMPVLFGPLLTHTKSTVTFTRLW